MLRCNNNSIYTGITNNLENRMDSHFSQRSDAAKYTKSHMPLKLEAVWKTKEKSFACKLEYRIKELSKEIKENLIIEKKLSTFFSGKIDCRRYRSIPANIRFLN